MRDLLERLSAELASGRRAALATIMRQEGSAPRGAGSRLLAGPLGLIAGTVGGGIAEAKVIEACAKACAEFAPRILDFEMDGTIAAASDMICGGNIRVLIEPFAPGGNMDALNAALAAPCRVIRPIPPKTAGWTVIGEDGSSAGAPLPANVAQILVATPIREAEVITADGQEYFCEICEAPERMIIVGAGHVSRPTAAIAALTGFQTVVIDDRADFACAARFPHAETIVNADYAHCLAPLDIRKSDYIVIITRGHLYDREVLEQALRTATGYIGMIGSHRKRDQIYSHLLANGFTQADLERVHSPIGLEIGAETPEEIAVSILAQCVAFRRGALASCQ